MKIALTGHTNIEKACGKLINNSGNSYNKDVFEQVYLEIENDLKIIAIENKIDFKNLTLISGMARGADEVLAEIAYRNNLNLILSIPHSIYWHKNRTPRRDSDIRAQAIEYDRYLNYDKSTIYEIKKSYGEGNHIYANFARNQHMVDESDALISYKRYDSTGTDDCIKRGKKQNKYIGNVGFIKFEKKDVQLEFNFD